MTPCWRCSRALRVSCRISARSSARSPVILVAGGESFNLALWALGLYCCVQFLESYLLTPLIQARAVSMPPAVVILNQLVFGAVFGLIGLALATPLAAAATVSLRHVFGAGEDKAGGRKSPNA